MARKNDIELFEVTEGKRWLTLKNYKTKSFEVHRTEDGYFYIWVNDVMNGRRLLSVVQSIEQAKTQIEIEVSK